MSKILNREKRRLSEKNSFHISQIANNPYTKAEVDALIAAVSPTIINPTHFLGLNGFADDTSLYGAALLVAFSDVNAGVKASYFVATGGDFTARIIHTGNGANNGKTAGGNIIVSYDVNGGVQAADVGPAVWDLPLENAGVLNIDDYGTPFTVADNSFVGVHWYKDDNAGGAANNMYIYGMVLVRQ